MAEENKLLSEAVSLEEEATAREREGDYQAVAMLYDRVIELRKALDLGNPEYRDDLARAHVNKGLALQGLGTPQALREAIESYEQAIELRKALDLGNPEYRDHLAGAQVNKGLALAGLGTPQALREAIESYEQAIELCKALDLGNPENNYDLAGARVNKGLALADLCTPQALREAIESYAQAIELLKALDLSIPKYSHRLAVAHMNKGNALQHLGTPQALREAIESYEQAIELLEALDLSNPEYRHGLAGTHMNKGNTLKHLGTPQALREAIESYEQAIELLEALDLSNPEYRHHLAGAHVNKGGALSRLRTPEALRKAIESCDQAIKLCEALDLSNPEYGNALAKAQINKGVALRDLDTPQALGEAIESYDRAINLTSTNGQPKDGRLDTMEVFCLAQLDKAHALLASERAMDATDAAEVALALLQDLEQVGIYALRGLREQLFAAAIDAYHAAREPQFLPELITEHLDPDRPGAAPASESIQRTALEGLRRGIEMLLQAPQTAQPLAELNAAAKRLHEWRVLYFGGTAASARLLAADHERRGDPDQALAILRGYIEARPLDAEGYLSLAEFYVRHQATNEVVQCYERAAAALVQGAPAGAQIERTGKLAELARLILEFRLTQILSEAKDPKSLTRKSDELHTWLVRDFMDRLFEPLDASLSPRFSDRERDDWQHPLNGEIDAVWKGFQEQRDHWIEQLVAQRAREAVQQAWERLKERSKDMIRTLCQGLPARWGDFTDRVVNAYLEAWGEFQEQWGTADEATRKLIEEKLAQALTHAVEQATQAIAEVELDEARAQLQRILGPIFDTVLNDAERRFLACGYRCLDDVALVRAAGSEFGLAVEYSLLDRIFAPLQALSRDRASALGTDRDRGDWIAKAITAYLTRQRPHLMLGEMVAAWNRALTRADDKHTETDRLLLDRVRQLPNPSALLVDDENAREQRKVLLERIKEIRNRCAHPHKWPSEEEIKKLRDIVASELDHSFYQYFGRAFLAVEA